MFRYNFIPLEETREGRLAIAIADPSQLMIIDEISLLLGKRIVTKVSTLKQISDILKKTEQSQRVLEEASEGFALDVIREDEQTGEETISIDRLTQQGGDHSPIIRLVDTTIFTALQRRASDIHIETRDDSVAIKFRIDGVLSQAMPPIGKEHHSTIISRIKVMSELDISERRVPQDGRFRVRFNGRAIDFRVSIMPSIHGEDAVLRVLDKESMSEKFRTLTLDVVGFDPEDLRKFRRYIKEPYGMVLVTGPTGSGKTTTLYAAVNEIKTDEDKIITIEDPVEYQLRGITQIPVNEKKGLTFARGLRSILRHDPDKIMVGEIRDRNRAIAINSALTGHLVFTTVHANNVVDVLGHFPIWASRPTTVSALNCIASAWSHHLRVLRAHRHYDEETLHTSGLDLEQWSTFDFREGAGCIECGGTGYRGRTAIHELLDLTDPIRELILEKKPTSEIRKLAQKEGMSFLRESAIDRVRRGLTTLKINGHLHRGIEIGPMPSKRIPKPNPAAARSPRSSSRRKAFGRHHPAKSASPSYAFAPLAGGALAPGVAEANIKAQDAVVEAVRKALDELAPKSRAVTLVLPDTAVRVFVLDFDTLPQKAAEAVPVLRFRLRKMVPFDVEHAALSYQVLVQSEAAVKVLATIMPGPVLAEYEAAVRAAGFEPGVVLPSSLASLSALDSLEPILAANLSGQALTTSITSGQDLHLFRTVDLPKIPKRAPLRFSATSCGRVLRRQTGCPSAACITPAFKTDDFARLVGDPELAWSTWFPT
jgi:type IV pilus assembly protein PilB